MTRCRVPAGYRSRLLIGIACAAALVAQTLPASADIHPGLMSGSDSVSRWLHAQPAVCAFFIEHRSYPGYRALTNDFNALPDLRDDSEWVYVNGQQLPARIGAAYDAAKRTALFRLSGTDAGFDALFADAGTPANNVLQKDLSRLAMAGKVHLGDARATVESGLNQRLTFNAPPAKGCAGFVTAAICTWGQPECACPEHAPYQRRALGLLVFQAGRVVAMLWDNAPCGYG